ncbi:MAG: cytochrome c [Burkholderiales bacterium]
MKAVRFSCMAALSVMLVAVIPVSAQTSDASRGQALYENHCLVCHTSQVHSRVNRIAISRVELREIVEKWQVQQKLTWSAQDVEDVVVFLNRTRYQFP